MKTDKVTFNDKTKEWLDSQKLPKNKIRYELAHTYLKEFVKGNNLKFLDAGGGNGLDSLPFAKDGHHITVLDYSEEMIQAAQEYANEELISENTKFIFDSVENTNKVTEENSYDVVLLHNVLSYVEDPEYVLRTVVSTLKPNGIFSLMQVNIYSEVYFPVIFHKDLDQALDKLDARETKAGLFDVKIKRFTAEELIEKVEKMGLKLEKRFGVSCLNTFIESNELKSNPEFYEKLKNLEILMSQRFPYYHLARFNQLIFRK